ncbi:NF-kappa-B inhibitor delta isoform X1 [Brienomyrus brachyistius]|uniref:NF-kappa-B inhibitor delta isoform X1 n=2 Tax=Brienomyrus brachyistius TaxID=42636 RepID=UPI0020B2FEB9|nr:NF-kappa-B inhibitor delta isoform X1 [Brienomyrus brachyistius]
MGNCSHRGKAPKENSCSLPTVKKLLEQKRKRETATSPSSSTSSFSLVTTSIASASVPVSLPEQGTQTGGNCSYQGIMGAVGPMLPPATSVWNHPNSPQCSNLQQDCPIPSVGGYFNTVATSLDCGQSQAYSPGLTPSFTTQQPDYSCAMSIHHYLECPMTVTLSGSVHSGVQQSLSYSWTPVSSLHSHGAPSPQGFGEEMDAGKLEEARMSLQAMDYSKKMWQDEDGDTILHIYTAKGLREYAFAAAENLRDLGKLDSKEHKGKTALLVAATANQSLIVQDLLLLGADVNACDDKGQTALHLAATYGFPRVMQTILSMGLNVNLEARNFEGLTPLHCAAISHSATMKSFFTPVSDLHSLAEDKLSCIQLLLSSGASLLSQDIKSNKTVLHLAVKEGNVMLVRILLQINLADTQAFVNMKAHGNTALHMAAGLHGSCHQEEVIRLLLNHGADPSIRNLENDQPAHLLQSGEKGEQLKFLLKKRNAASRRRITSLQDQE